jgi:hypothetical protein
MRWHSALCFAVEICLKSAWPLLASRRPPSAASEQPRLPNDAAQDEDRCQRTPDGERAPFAVEPADLDSADAADGDDDAVPRPKLFPGARASELCNRNREGAVPRRNHTTVERFDARADLLRDLLRPRRCQRNADGLTGLHGRRLRRAVGEAASGQDGRCHSAYRAADSS